MNSVGTKFLVGTMPGKPTFQRCPMISAYSHRMAVPKQYLTNIPMIMITFVLVSITLLLPSCSIHAYGYSGGKKFIRSRDWGHSVQQTTDGGYIIAGTTWRFGAMYGDVYLIKTDVSGNRVWGKMFGRGGVDWGHSVRQTTDGGFIIAGATWRFGAMCSDVYLIKTDANGNKEWSKTFGGSGRDYANAVVQSTNGGYIIVGQTDSFGAGDDDVYLIKTDVSGNEIWSRTFGGSRGDYGHAVRQTVDGGYVIVGNTKSLAARQSEVYFIKTDCHGSKLWSKTFGGGYRAWGKSLEQTSDGGYIIAGSKWPFGGRQSDVYLIKTDADGKEVWSKTFGGKYADHANAVQQTTDAGYIIAGNTWPFGNTGNSDVYLIKTDANGNKAWSRTFGRSRGDYGHAVRQTVDGGYVIVGQTDSFGAGDDDVYLIKTDASGNKVWSKTFGQTDVGNRGR